MAEIVISYRRGDIYAELLRDFLEKKLYPGVAFLDVYDLGAGPIQGPLREKVQSAKLVILVIGKVFELRGAELSDQNDYVGQEIRAADDAHVPILPILVDRDIDKIHIPNELSNVLAIQNRLEFKANTIGLLKQQLPQILPKVVPFLPGYWKRRADYWWRWAAAMAVIALGLLLLWVVEIRTEAVGTIIQRFRARRSISDLLQDGRLTLTSLEYGTAFVQNLSPNIGTTPPGLRARNWMDGWIRNLNAGVSAKGGGNDRCRLVVATVDLKQSFRDFEARLTIENAKLPADKHYTISELYAFLVSGDSSNSVYRPIYRQVPAEYLPPTPSDIKPVTVLDTDDGEKLRLFVVVCKTNPAVGWPDEPVGLGLSLEVR
jgi:hypothetical protein